MFSVREKRMISEAIQRILRSTRHPELPADEIQFRLLVQGAAESSWAAINNNGAVPKPAVNDHNERQDAGAKILLIQGTAKDEMDAKRWAEIIQEGGDIINSAYGKNILSRDLGAIAEIIRRAE